VKRWASIPTALTLDTIVIPKEMKLPDNKYTQMAVYYAATVAAFIVGISTFIYRSWVDNNMNDKVRSFINKTFSIISNISDVIVNETTVNVATKVTK